MVQLSIPEQHGSHSQHHEKEHHWRSVAAVEAQVFLSLFELLVVHVGYYFSLGEKKCKKLYKKKVDFIFSPSHDSVVLFFFFQGAKMEVDIICEFVFFTELDISFVFFFFHLPLPSARWLLIYG